MIKIIRGNLLHATEDLIGHSVNSHGKLGAGLDVKIRLYYPEAFIAYEELCKNAIKHKKDLLGDVQCVPINEKQSILNIFGQKWYGRGEMSTDYGALIKAFKLIKRDFSGKSLAIPYNMGCGLGGGNWDTVYDIIEQNLGDENVIIYRPC